MEINSSFEEDNRVKARNYSGSGASYVSDPKVKLMCSYGGKILPRPSDGKLRYAGGDTRMISVSRYINFGALQQKMVDIYGPHLTLKYQLPEEDLDALVTVSSDEDLENMMDECDRLAVEGSSRLRVFVFSSIDADAPDTSLADPRLLEQQYVDAVNALQVDASFRRSDGSATLPPFIPAPMFEGHPIDVTWDAAQRAENFSPVIDNHNFTTFLDKEYASSKFPPLYPNGVAPAVAVSQTANELQRRQHPEPSAFVPVHPPVGTIGSDFRDLESGGSASSSSSSQHDPYHQASNQRWHPGVQNQSYLESMSYINGKDQLGRGSQQYTALNSAVDSKINTTDVSVILPRKMAEKPTKIDGIRSTSPEVKKVDLDAEESRPLSPGALLQRQLLADLNNNNPNHKEGLQILMNSGLRQQHSESLRLQEDLSHESTTVTTCTIQPPVPQTVVDPLVFPATSSKLSPQAGDFTSRVDSFTIEVGGHDSSKSNPVIYTPLDYGVNHPIRSTPDSLHDIRTQVNSTITCSDEMPQVQPQVQVPLTTFPVHTTLVSSDAVSQAQVPVTSFSEQKRESEYKFGQTKPSPWDGPDIASYLFPKPGTTFDDEVPDLNNTPKIKDDSGNTNKITTKPVESQEERQEPISVVSRMDTSGVSLLDEIQYDNKAFAPSDSDLNLDSYPHTMGVSVAVPDIAPFSRTADLLQSDMDLSTSHVHLVESHSDENINAKMAEPFSAQENAGCGTFDQDMKTLGQQKTVLETRQVNGEIKLTIDDEEDALPIGEPLPPNHFAVHESFVESWSTTLQSHKDQRVAVPVNNQVKDLSLMAEKLSIEDTKTDIEDLDAFQSATDGTIRATFDLSHHIAVSAEEMAKNSGLQIIRYHDLEELRELGSGTFGTVYHGKWRGTDVAIKKIKSSCFTGRPSERDRLIADFWQEASLLGQLHHPNVVAFYGVVPDGPDGTLATVTEYMVNGSLKQALQKKDRLLDRRKRLLIAMDAAFGMEYLHGKNIVHFDLKCENLLVNLRDLQRPICKVGDLGLSKVKQQTMISGGVRGTLPWMAPELLNGRSSLVSEKVDVFSFGIVLWEILTGDEPYADMHYGAIIGGIVSNTLRPEIPESCDPAYKSLMEACWATDPAKRPTFSEIARSLRMMESTLSAKARAQVQTASG